MSKRALKISLGPLEEKAWTKLIISIDLTAQQPDRGNKKSG